MRPHGWAGLAVMAGAEVLLIAGVEPAVTFFTPIIWWGYLLLADGLLAARAGGSLFTTRRRELTAMLPLSIGCWLVFELYNLHLRNWEYHGLPDVALWRGLGYALSFATIFPALFLTAELLRTWGPVRAARGRPIVIRPAEARLLVLIGAACLVVPVLLPHAQARYLFGLVWVGFVLLLDPITRGRGGESLLREWEEGSRSLTYSLLASGGICGFLWEFWNYWAGARWVYHIPFWDAWRIFEMPVVGFLGFFPFALECFAMYQFARTLGLVPSPATAEGRLTSS